MYNNQNNSVMKKKNYLWSVLIMVLTVTLCLGLTSCNPEEDDEVSVLQPTLNVSGDGGSPSVTIKSNTSWIITGNPDWATPSQLSGKDDATIQINVKRNSDTVNPRSCTFTIIAGSAQATISISQEKGSRDYSVVGTTWSRTYTYENGVSETISISFSTRTATYNYTMTQGTQSLSDYATYTYNQSVDFIIMTPDNAEKHGVLECKIIDGIKMQVTNKDNRDSTFELYKQ